MRETMAAADAAEIEKIAHESPHTIDEILSKDLLRLSLKERNAIDEEVHGVKSLAPRESPELLDNALARLAEELERIPNDSPSKAAYLESQTFPGTYVNGSDFRLRFLRCELFDARKAAIRMTNFLDLAAELFGTDALRRPMKQSDFTREEEKQLRIGEVQILPYRDRSGRPVFTRVGNIFISNEEQLSRIKINLYFFYVLSEDVETQRSGVISLGFFIWCKYRGALPSWEVVESFKRFSEAVPIRTCCIHACFPDTPHFRVLRFMFGWVKKDTAPRIKFHIGEETEVLYTLKTFGIPVDLIPITGTGNIKTGYIKQWLRAQRCLEESRALGNGDMSIILCPRFSDVIFRPGTKLWRHPGNSVFQSLIQSRMDEHSAASQPQKMAITKKIIDEIQKKEGRILQWDTRGWWTEVKGASQIHTKVAAAVKVFKGKSAAHQNALTPQSSTGVFQNQDGKRRKLSNDDDCLCFANCAS